jgi:hypothetical protein
MCVRYQMVCRKCFKPFARFEIGARALEIWSSLATTLLECLKHNDVHTVNIVAYTRSTQYGELLLCADHFGL